MKIVSRDLDALRMPERNIRRHSDKQIREYIRSLEMFGQIKPIVIDEGGTIIAGNGLFMALREMGKKTCECYVAAGLSEKQKKKLMLADNRVYELGITDMDAFEEIVKELEGDIDVPGWEEDLLSMMNSCETDIDEAIESYGTYSAPDVKRIDSRREEESKPPEQPSKPAEEERQHIVVCPNCGERICL